MSNRIAIIGTPRSGSSYLASKFKELGYGQASFSTNTTMSASMFNKDGYFEDTFLTLLNDQLIRYKYGNGFSFLNPPNVNEVIRKLDVMQPWEFDLESSSIDYPVNFDQNVQDYCGQNWDVWGLSRMTPGGKWHKAYSQLGINNDKALYESLSHVVKSLKRLENFYVKDARLIFVLDEYNEVFDRVIFLTRNPETLLQSIRNHYGQRLFQGPNFACFDRVSNYSNYKVPLMQYEEYLFRYKIAMEKLSKSENIIHVTLEEIDNSFKFDAWANQNNLILH